MSWRVALSLGVLGKQANLLAPNRSKRSDGTIGDAAHRARKSEHNPDANGVVRARDITHDPANGMDARKVTESIRLSKDPRVLYVIFNGRMFSSYPVRGLAPFTWRPYSGSNQHKTHLHVSVVSDPALYDDTSLWAFIDEEQGDENMGIRAGEKGPHVAALQRHLNAWNPALGLTVDGEYGRSATDAGKTGAAVASYQANAGLRVVNALHADDTTLSLVTSNALRDPEAFARLQPKRPVLGFTRPTMKRGRHE